jgi:hypothetical protein
VQADEISLPAERWGAATKSQDDIGISCGAELALPIRTHPDHKALINPVRLRPRCDPKSSPRIASSNMAAHKFLLRGPIRILPKNAVTLTPELRPSSEHSPRGTRRASVRRVFWVPVVTSGVEPVSFSEWSSTLPIGLSAPYASS